MNVDLTRFASLLTEARSDEFLETSGLSGYLMDALFHPYMAGENIPLNSLDYAAFELEDLDRLFEYIGDLETVYAKLSEKAKKLCQSTPAPCLSRAFC